MEKPGIKPVTPGLQDIGLSPTPWWALKNFMWLFHGSSQYWARRIYGSFLYFVTGAPEDSPKMALWRSQESNIYHGAREKTFCGFPRYKPVLPGWFKMCVLALRREHPKAQRKRFYGEARNRTWDPWFSPW